MLQKPMTDLSLDITGLISLVVMEFHAKQFAFAELCSKANAESNSKHYSCDLPPVQALLSEIIVRRWWSFEINTINLWAEGTSPLTRLLVSTEIAEGWLESWGSAFGQRRTEGQPWWHGCSAGHQHTPRQGELSQTRAAICKGKVALK